MINAEMGSSGYLVTKEQKRGALEAISFVYSDYLDITSTAERVISRGIPGVEDIEQLSTLIISFYATTDTPACIPEDVSGDPLDIATDGPSADIYPDVPPKTPTDTPQLTPVKTPDTQQKAPVDTPSTAVVHTPKDRKEWLKYKMLKLENQKLRKREYCRNCKTKKLTTSAVTLLPCGHVLYCNDCAEDIFVCSCRADILGTVRTFLS